MFSSLNISKKLASYDQVCAHWLFGTCAKSLPCGYLKCIKAHGCSAYEEQDSHGEIILELVIRAMDDYTLLKRIWFELAVERHTEGSVEGVSWKPRGSRLELKGLKNGSIGMLQMLLLLNHYEEWKTKLKLFK